jgi:hypothetical protein
LGDCLAPRNSLTDDGFTRPVIGSNGNINDINFIKTLKTVDLVSLRYAQISRRVIFIVGEQLKKRCQYGVKRKCTTHQTGAKIIHIHISLPWWSSDIVGDKETMAGGEENTEARLCAPSSFLPTLWLNLCRMNCPHHTETGRCTRCSSWVGIQLEHSSGCQCKLICLYESSSKHPSHWESLKHYANFNIAFLPRITSHRRKRYEC